jgi:hypothetical protein
VPPVRRPLRGHRARPRYRYPYRCCLSWPGQTVDAAGCLDAITGAFGPSVASTVVVLPLDWIPLTEQGKPNRPEIRRLARELADEPSPS